MAFVNQTLDRPAAGIGAVRAGTRALLEFLASEPSNAHLACVDVLIAHPHVADRLDEANTFYTELLGLRTGKDSPTLPAAPIVGEAIVGGVFELLHDYILRGDTPRAGRAGRAHHVHRPHALPRRRGGLGRRQGRLSDQILRARRTAVLTRVVVGSNGRTPDCHSILILFYFHFLLHYDCELGLRRRGDPDQAARSADPDTSPGRPERMLDGELEWLHRTRAPTGRRAERLVELSAITDRLAAVLEADYVPVWLNRPLATLGHRRADRRARRRRLRGTLAPHRRARIPDLHIARRGRAACDAHAGDRHVAAPHPRRQRPPAPAAHARRRALATRRDR